MTIINPLTTVRSLLPAVTAAASPEARQFGLQAGQMVQATVAEGGLTTVSLDLDRQRFQAKTEMPLETGEKLRLLVVETSPQLKLRLIRDSLLERLTHSIHLLDDKWSMTKLLSRLHKRDGSQTESSAKLLTLLETLFSSSSPLPSGPQLANLLRKMGLTLESDLAHDPEKVEKENLKSTLLAMQKNLPEQDAELEDSLNRLLHKIELFQLCNLRLERQGAFLIPLPLPFLENGYLVMEDGGGEKKNPAQAKITLHLELQGLGELRIDLLQDEGGLFLRFTCPGQKEVEFIAGFESELRSMLTGMPLYGTSYGCGSCQVDKDLIRRVWSDQQDLLNTRV